ncbi:F-box/LRR-repeat protein-like protein [Tanacetum coccineum]
MRKMLGVQDPGRSNDQDYGGECGHNLDIVSVLSLDIGLPQENFKRNSIPFLPNIKNLRLTFDVKNDDSLLEFTNLAKACPTLETFTLPWTWSMPLNRRRKVRHAANHPQNHLKFLELLGYCGQMSELELAVYFIDNAFGLTRNSN